MSKRTLISMALCGLLALAVMVALGATSARASVEPVSTSPIGPVCNTALVTNCTASSPYTRTVAVTVTVQRGTYVYHVYSLLTGYSTRVYISKTDTNRLTGYALMGAGTFVGTFCGTIPNVVAKAGCAVAAGAEFYHLRSTFINARAAGKCVVYRPWVAASIVTCRTTTVRRLVAV